MKVKSLMLPCISMTLDGSRTFGEVARFFDGMRVESITVMNDGEFVGLLSREDFEGFRKHNGLAYERSRLDAVLDRMELCRDFCEPSASILEVFVHMANNKLDQMAVKSFDRVIGLIRFSAAYTAVVNGLPTTGDVDRGNLVQMRAVACV